MICLSNLCMQQVTGEEPVPAVVLTVATFAFSRLGEWGYTRELMLTLQNEVKGTPIAPQAQKDRKGHRVMLYGIQGLSPNSHRRWPLALHRRFHHYDISACYRVIQVSVFLLEEAGFTGGVHKTRCFHGDSSGIVPLCRFIQVRGQDMQGNIADVACQLKSGPG